MYVLSFRYFLRSVSILIHLPPISSIVSAPALQSSLNFSPVYKVIYVKLAGGNFKVRVSPLNLELQEVSQSQVVVGVHH